nr:fibrobacter succinogenes major paralogous domain-containing protein [Bacteroidota bacterium]
CWMAENLKTETYKNGVPIPNVTNSGQWLNLFTGAYVWYDNDISWKGPYGALYNWFSVVDENGLCPEGWHVPSKDEWTEFTNFIGGSGAASAPMIRSCRQINSPMGGECNTSEHPRWEYPENLTFGTDDFGFSALPGGYRVGLGDFDQLGRYGAWWSTTEFSFFFSWGRNMFFDTEQMGDYYDYKQVGRSVRCIKD